MVEPFHASVHELSVETSNSLAQQLISNNNSNEQASDSNEQLMNGYFEENASDSEDSGSNHENSDNDNFYDDNCEDYEENYILHSDLGPVIEDFNINLEEDEEDNEEDDEIVQITARESHDNDLDLEQDNRYHSDGRENSDIDADNDESDIVNTYNNILNSRPL